MNKTNRKKLSRLRRRLKKKEKLSLEQLDRLCDEINDCYCFDENYEIKQLIKKGMKLIKELDENGRSSI